MFKFGNKNNNYDNEITRNQGDTEIIGSVNKYIGKKDLSEEAVDFEATQILKNNVPGKEPEATYEETQFVDRRKIKSTPGIRISLQDRYFPGRVYDLFLTDSLIIGRSPELCDIVIAHDQTVSSRQCKIFLREGEVYVSDLKGTNITYVNDEAVREEKPLRSEDILGFGKVDLIITILSC